MPEPFIFQVRSHALSLVKRQSEAAPLQQAAGQGSFQDDDFVEIRISTSVSTRLSTDSTKVRHGFQLLLLLLFLLRSFADMFKYRFEHSSKKWCFAGFFRVSFKLIQIVMQFQCQRIVVASNNFKNLSFSKRREPVGCCPGVDLWIEVINNCSDINQVTRESSSRFSPLSCSFCIPRSVAECWRTERFPWILWFPWKLYRYFKKVSLDFGQTHSGHTNSLKPRWWRSYQITNFSYNELIRSGTCQKANSSDNELGR